MLKESIVKNRILSKLRNTELYKKHLIGKGIVLKYKDIPEYQNQAPPIIFNLDKEYKTRSPMVGIVQNGLRFDDYVYKNASWLFYERYLKNNNIKYEYYDIFKSNWIEEAKKYDIIMWHVNSTPAELGMAQSKIYILDHILGKFCFPSFHEIWQYEDKSRASYLYEIYGIPRIPTFLTNSYQEAIEFIDKANFPIVAKVNIGASSSGVKKLDNFKEAKKYIKEVFSPNGRKTIYSYIRHKDYVLFQEFIEDSKYDLRIMIIGDKAFGYYRYPNKGDFRASGAGNYEKKAIPHEAIKIAIDVKNKLNSRLMGVDMLHSNKHNQYFIIETSLFNQIDTAEQLKVDGIAGYYDISNINDITFKPGRYWIHELVMDEVIRVWYDASTNEQIATNL